MVPAFKRFILLPANAFGLARYKATSICSSVTPLGRLRTAILLSVSPDLTLTSDALEELVSGLGSDVAEGVGAGAGAGPVLTAGSGVGLGLGAVTDAGAGV